MRKKYLSKIITFLITLILIIFTIAPFSNANSFWDDGDKFIQQSDKIDTNKVRESLMPIGRTLVTIANILLPIIFIAMGVKYMMADSPDKRAKLKTQLIGLVVSMVVIYGAQIIWSIVYNIMNSATK